MSFHAEKWVYNRKDAQCFGCCRILPSKALMRKVSGRDSEGFYYCKLCAICHCFWEQNSRKWDYRFYEGELYNEGWSDSADGGEFVSKWLETQKPLSISYEGYRLKPKKPTV